MTALVACPKCKTRLKLQSLPVESKKIQCPKCQTYFMVSAPKPTGATAKPQAKAPPGRTQPARGSGKGKWIAIAAALLLAVGGGSAAYFFTRGQSQPEKQSGPYDTHIVANKEKEKEKVKEDPPKKEHVHDKPRVRDNKHHEFTRHMVKAGLDSQARAMNQPSGTIKTP